METARKLTNNLSFDFVENVFQEHEKDLNTVKGLLREEKADGQSIFITPEPERYADILRGERILTVDISRVVDIFNWQTVGHRKNVDEAAAAQPDIEKARTIFLDTVSYTGRTVAEIGRQFRIDKAIFEIIGARAPREIAGRNIIGANFLSGFVAVWHLDDFVQKIPVDGRLIKPSEFVKEVYPKLKMDGGHELRRDEFLPALVKNKIERKQTSPNLFLELARPSSYLGRSFIKDQFVLENQIPLIEELESLYSQRER